MDISIQIVNFKTIRYLEVLVEDIINDLKSSKLMYEILILDNASGDDLSELQQKYKKHSNIKFYFNDKNTGFGSGQNKLNKYSLGKYLIIANPDIHLNEENTIERLYNSIESYDDNVAAIGPRLLTKKLEPQFWDHGEILGLKARFLTKLGASTFSWGSTVREVAWLAGTFFMIRKNVYEKLNGFDENYFMYAEENDLFTRFRELGHKVMYLPNINVVHVRAGTNTKHLYFSDSADYYVKKHFGKKWYFFLLYPFYLIEIIRYKYFAKS